MCVVYFHSFLSSPNADPKSGLLAVVESNGTEFVLSLTS